MYMKIKTLALIFLITGQVIKGVGRMPWHWEPMKDVISCDKLGGVARKL